MKRFSHAVLIGLLCAVPLISCSTIDVYQYQHDSTLDEVYVKQDADFSRYTSVMIDPISVWYPNNYAPSPELTDKAQNNLARAQVLFRETIAKALSDRYAVTDKPGKNVLRVHVEFVDLRSVPQGTNVPADLNRYKFKAQPGYITMVGQLFDARSGKQLVRVADMGKQQSVGGNGVVDWDAIAADFEYWANVFSVWLERNNKV